MQRSTRKRTKEGQATLLVLVALALFLLAGIGLTLDVSQLYAQRQLAQNAADAAALAAIMSLYNATNTGANTFGNIPTGGGNPARFTCGASDNHTPCYYARQNGFDPANGDTVFVDFWDQANAFSQEPGVSISNAAQDTVPLLRVTVLRPVPATLMAMVGGGSKNVAAQATAAITTSISPIPIMILHPTASGSLSLSGTPNITICGGPQRSIQVNSCAGDGGSIAKPNGSGSVSCGTSGASLSLGGSSSINLSKAGPLDTGDCKTGTGADLGNFGLPTTAPGGISFGTTGRYLDPASAAADPLLNVSPPTTTGLSNQDSSACTEAAGRSTCTDGGGNAVLCPTDDAFGSATGGCVVLKPGLYTSSGPLGNLKNNFYIFTPGIYYVQSGGISFAANSGGQTETVPPVAAPGPYPTCTNPDANTGCGVLFFLAADGSSQNTLSVGANAGDIALLGSDPTLSYQKIVIFVDHTAVAQSHSFGGGGSWNVTGTVYATNTIVTTLNSTNQAQFQSFSFGGSSGSGTVTGEIIVDELSMHGTPSIQMNLDPSSHQIRQIALVR